MKMMKCSAVPLLAAALSLLSLLTVLHVASTQPAHQGGNEAQDTMYDLEGSTDDQLDGGSGDEFGSGETDAGSGSSGVKPGGGNNPDCQLPPRGTFPEPASFESDVLPEIQCHLACVEHVMSQDNVTLQVSTNYGVWPTIQDSVLERNCSIYQKVEECRLGCLTLKLQPSLKEGRCALQCSRTCNQSCFGSPNCWIKGSTCTKKCSESSCRDGCRLYETVISQPSGVIPYSPRSKPSLFAPQVATGAGIYTVDAGSPLGNLSTFEGGQLPGTEPLTSFIFRVLHDVSDTITYYWLHSLDDELNLGAFSCKDDVLVQYAAVNKYGRSTKWSPAAEIDVYGADGIPSPDNPDHDSISFHLSPDLRFGFWKHAVISLFWERPRGFHFVDHFVVTLHPNSFTCGRRQISFSVPRELTRAQIQAQTPNQGPVSGCIYEISVASVAVSGMSVPPVRKVLYNVEVSNPVPIQFQCTRSWSDLSGTFQFQLNWSIPNSMYLHNAISKFHVLLSFTSPRAHDETKDEAEVIFEMGQSDYHYLTKKVRYGITGSYYKIKMNTHSTLSDHILVPELRTCEFDAAPPPPQPPTIVTISNNSVNFQTFDVESGMGLLSLELEWNLVTGNISSYEISVVELEPDFGIGEERVVIETFHSQELKLLKHSAELTVEVPVTTNDGCLYVQVRTISAHGGISNWSSPECVFVAGLTLPTSQSQETTPTMRGDATPSDAGSILEVPIEMLYIVLSVAGVVLVATVILTFFVCLACYQNRRSSKKAKQFQQKIQQSNLEKAITPPSTPTKTTFQSPKLLFQGGKPFTSNSLKKSAEDWELHPCQIIVEENLGQGGFGEVYQGTIRGGVGLYKSNCPQIMRVAVKVLRAATSKEEKRAFLDHIEQTKLVTNQLTTPHVVKMIGCVTLHEPHCLVTELPARGDLLTYLVNCRENILNPKAEEEPITPQYTSFLDQTSSYSTLASVVPKAAAAVKGEPFRESAMDYKVETNHLLSFAGQIASGMEYLSAIGVVHGDLACRNMYLDENYDVKISDFGINTREKGKHRLYVKVGRTRLPLRWMAPEAIAEGQLTVASDVWAFGVTLWEIITLGGFPYIDVSNKDLLQSLFGGRRLEHPPNCSNEIYEVVKQCCSLERADRPTFTALHKSLKELATSDDPNSHIKLQDIEPQSLYYQPRRHHDIKGDRERVSEEIKRGGEDSVLEDETESTDRDDVDGERSLSNIEGSLRSHPFTLYVLPQIVEDEIGEKTEELKMLEEKEDLTSPSIEPSSDTHKDQNGSNSRDTPSTKEEDGEMCTSDCAEELSSGAVTPAISEMNEGMRSESTSPDSGCNMGQS